MHAPLTTCEPVRSVYVHVPFCQTICGYCDFFSVRRDRFASGPLIAALRAELASERRLLTLPVETVFVGGGTPTTLPPAELQALLQDLAALLPAAPSIAEFTVEANPATVSTATADALAAGGVNRVSVGAQSFHATELAVLERLHDPHQVGETVRACRAAGITRINLDLIFGIPGQSVTSWRESLEMALALGVDHLACYALTYEEGTPLFAQRAAGRVSPCDPDLEADLYEAAIETLAAAGLEQYEISNFARPGQECRHNLVYWRNEPYLGVGPSAAGYAAGVRYKNVAAIGGYIERVRRQGSGRQTEELPDWSMAVRDTLLMGLRLNAGIQRGRFSDRFGRDLMDLAPAVAERQAADGLLCVEDAAIRLTRRGRMLADGLIAEWLEAVAPARF